MFVKLGSQLINADQLVRINVALGEIQLETHHRTLTWKPERNERESEREAAQRGFDELVELLASHSARQGKLRKERP